MKAGSGTNRRILILVGLCVLLALAILPAIAQESDCDDCPQPADLEVGALVEPQYFALEVSEEIGPDVAPILVEGNPMCSNLGLYEVAYFESYNPQDGTGTGYNATVNGVTVSSTDNIYFSWWSTIGIDRVIVKGSNAANAYIYDPPGPESYGDDLLHAPINDSGSYAELSHISFCVDYELRVSKTAAGTYDRTYSWTITKGPDQNYTGFIGDVAFPHDYVVSVDQTVTDSNHVVSGTITVYNDAPFEATGVLVSDTLNAGGFSGSVSVTCPSTTIVAGGSMDCSYTQAVSSAVSGTNSATATASNMGPGTGTADVAFGAPTLNGYSTVNVTDTNGGLGSASGDTSWPYSLNFQCPGDPALYTNGVYHMPAAVNTATITETGASDTATVNLTCYAPVVTKDAAAQWVQTYTWDIFKTADPTSHSGVSGDTFSSAYDVTVDQTVVNQYGASGKVYVTNPAGSPGAMTVNVSDAVDGIGATVNCGGGLTSLTVAAGQTGNCDYTVVLPDSTDRTNTATVGFNGLNFLATALVDFGSPTVVGHPTVNVMDSEQGALGSASGDKTFEYNRPFVCSTNPADYTNGVDIDTYPNTATIVETTQSKNASVTVTCSLPALVVEKTAAGEWDRTVTWDLTKSVSEDYFSGFAGATFPDIWTVIATKTDSGPQNYYISGSITISNPSAIVQTFGVTDVLDDGTPVSLNCPVYSVDPGEAVICTYEAFPANASATLNTATVTAVGNPDQVATAAVGWDENLFGSDEAHLVDGRFGYDQIIMGSVTETFNETFACSPNQSDYVNGSDHDDYTNTAVLTVGDVAISRDVTVAVDCVLPALTVTKTAAGEWDRTVTWDLTKSVVPASHSGFAGDTFGSTWTVVADKTDSGPMNFVVTGSISIYNPAAVTQYVTGVADVLNDDPATVATVSCGAAFPIAIAPLGTLNCTYSAVPVGSTATLNTATVTAVGNLPQSDDDAIEWDEHLTGYDEGTLSDARFEGEPWLYEPELISGDVTRTFDETFACPTDASLYVDGVYSFIAPNLAHLNDHINLDAAAEVTVTCTLPALVVDKTAAGVWDRTVTWELMKSVADDVFSGSAGASFPDIWTVVATKHDSGPMNYAIAGNISIYNPAPIAQTFIVDDVLDDGTLVTVSCPSNTVAAGATVVCPYAAAPDDATATLNTAMVTAVGNLPQTDTATVGWTEHLTGSDTANLTDPDFAYDENINVTTSVDFDETFTCSTDPARYTNGSYTETFTNDAYLVNLDTNLHADADVMVTCTLPALVVDKTAAGEWDRTVTWELTKGVDPASHSGFAGDTFLSTWTVVATKNDSGPQNYRVTGSISIYNPSAVTQIVTGVADLLGDGTGATVDCGADFPINIAPLDTLTCTYSAAPVGSTATLNTATVSAVGNADQSDTAAVGWHENLTGYDSGTLSDARFEGEPWLYEPELISGDVTRTFDETFACPTDASLYVDGVYSFIAPNLAHLNDNIDLDASAEVTVNCYLPSISKTADGTYDRIHTWEIDKSVVGPTNPGYPGDTLGWTWTVNVYETVTHSNFAVTGEITVVNPNPDDDLVVALADVVNGNTAVIGVCADDIILLTEFFTFANGELTVPAGKTAICAYTALDLPYTNVTTAPKTNTATATYTFGEGATDFIEFVATDPIEYAANDIGEPATVIDPEVIGLEDNPVIEGTDNVVVKLERATYTGTGSQTCSTLWSAYGDDGFYDGSPYNLARVEWGAGLYDEDDASTYWRCEAVTVRLLKLTNGIQDPAHLWTFTLNGGGVSLTDTTPPPLVDFGAPALRPGSYTICETNVSAGWTSFWWMDLNGDSIFTDNEKILPYNPDQSLNPPQDLGNRCFDFTLTAPQLASFQVDNTYPGGDPRTPGYWKNWNSCTGGGQWLTHFENGNITIDDVLNYPGISWAYLSFPGGYPTAAGCVDAVSILDTRDIDSGKKMASDAAYNLARNLLAAQLNLGAGACYTQGVLDAVASAQGLLDGLDFDGTGTYLRRGTVYNQALSLAGYLDQYNNGMFCGSLMP